MTTVLTPKKKITYAQALRLVRQLAPAEQRRLRDELTLQRCLASVGVYLVRPNSSANAIRRGRRLAKTIQAELAAAVTASLDETIPLT
jgi:hypothetical protein